jgi:hypothetical protein
MLSSGPKKDRVTGHWRERHSEELLDLYTSPNNVQIIKSTEMSVVGLVALTGEKNTCIQNFSGKTRVDYLEVVGADEGMVLQRIRSVRRE